MKCGMFTTHVLSKRTNKSQHNKKNYLTHSAAGRETEASLVQRGFATHDTLDQT